MSKIDKFDKNTNFGISENRVFFRFLTKSSVLPVKTPFFGIRKMCDFCIFCKFLPNPNSRTKQGVFGSIFTPKNTPFLQICIFADKKKTQNPFVNGQKSPKIDIFVFFGVLPGETLDFSRFFGNPEISKFPHICCVSVVNATFFFQKSAFFFISGYGPLGGGGGA